MSELKSVQDAVQERLDRLSKNDKMIERESVRLKARLQVERELFHAALSKRLVNTYQIDLSGLSIHVETAELAQHGTVRLFMATVSDSVRELARLHGARSQDEIEKYHIFWKAHHVRYDDTLIQHTTDDFIAALTFAYTGRTERSSVYAAMPEV